MRLTNAVVSGESGPLTGMTDTIARVSPGTGRGGVIAATSGTPRNAGSNAAPAAAAEAPLDAVSTTKVSGPFTPGPMRAAMRS